MYDEQICEKKKTYKNTKTISIILGDYYAIHDIAPLAAYIRMANPDDPEYRDLMKKQIKELAAICNDALKELEE